MNTPDRSRYAWSRRGSARGCGTARVLACAVLAAAASLALASRSEAQPAEDADWGDAPDVYATLAASNGPAHTVVPGYSLGAAIDAEPDGQPSLQARDDDINGAPPFDEDGVAFLSPITVGGSVNLAVVLTDTAGVGSAFLDAWIDFNGNGSFDAGEHLFGGASASLAAGSNSLTFNVPAGAVAGTTYARFRLSSNGGLTPTDPPGSGPAVDGEVEDYTLEIEPSGTDHKMHWAQLPDPNGWDVFAEEPKDLADDFRCTESGPITEIVFWGSWRANEVFNEQIAEVRLSIHRDDRSGPYSKPGELLWTAEVPPDPAWFTIEEEEQGLQGWYNPNTGEVIFGDHTRYFRYTVDLAAMMDPADLFEQVEGEIYWLDIQMVNGDGEWGWKTSRSAHFEDDAVWADLINGWPPSAGEPWQELIDPETGESLDLAFVIRNPEPADLLDWGDAPDQPYPTLSGSGGASHIIQPGVYLGSQVDSEPDGQPTVPADGDDIDVFYPPANDDEDGVTFPSPLVVGQIVPVTVVASQSGQLDVFVDFNIDGDWNDAGEVAYSGPVTASVSGVPIPLTIPPTAAVGQTYARFRYNVSGAVLGPQGPWTDGEVEDYQIFIDEPSDVYDWGDAPDAPFPTLLASNGAHHQVVAGVYLGLQVDSEPDGQPDPAALGDDKDLNYPPANDDEDGVTLPAQLPIGQASTVTVAASVSGWLDAWIDFNGDGVWGAGESILSGPFGPGAANITFTPPLGSSLPGQSYARFRFHSGTFAIPPTGGPLTGLAVDGEVEDYAVELIEVDFGDADQTAGYPVRLAVNGARHQIVPGIELRNPAGGLTVDPEADGQPTPAFDGDDNDGNDDENGVQFLTQLAPGLTGTIRVYPTVNGVLELWIDYNQDGAWSAGEKTSKSVTAPQDSVQVSVPGGALTGPTGARFRFSTAGGLSPTGFAPDGEVEDYTVTIEPPKDFGDAPDGVGGFSYPTTLLSGGAAHVTPSPYFLGALIDTEIDGQPDINALGDDLAALADEDGVVIASPPNAPAIGGFAALIGGTTAEMQFLPSQPGLINVWIDYDGDSVWNSTTEWVFQDQPVNPADPPYPFFVPDGVGPLVTYMRVRFSSVPGIGPAGVAPDGEVEDYKVILGKRVPSGIALNTGTLPISVDLTWSPEPGASYYEAFTTTDLTSGPIPSWSITSPVTSTYNDTPLGAKKFYTIIAWP